VSFFDLEKIIFPGKDVFFEFQLYVSRVSYALHNEMETRGGPIAVMYVRGVRIYAHRYFCVVPTPVCVIYANCSCPFYFLTPNDHVFSLRSIPLVYLLKLNSELFFFHVMFLYVFPSRAPRVRNLRLIVIPPFVVDTK
jgi:hypothetical protein